MEGMTRWSLYCIVVMVLMMMMMMMSAQNKLYAPSDDDRKM